MTSSLGLSPQNFYPKSPILVTYSNHRTFAERTVVTMIGKQTVLWVVAGAARKRVVQPPWVAESKGH